LRRRHSQADRLQPSYQLSTLDHGRPCGDQVIAKLGRDVVVIAVEPAAWYTVRLGELMQLVERGIADQMTPPPVSMVPARLVDQDGHSAETGTLER